MTIEPNPRIPLACVPDAIPAADRPAHRALTRALFAETVEAHEPLAAGHAFRFPAGALADLGRFVAGERKCCPFLAFTIEVTPAEGPVWLRLTGPEGTCEFLEVELSL